MIKGDQAAEDRLLPDRESHAVAVLQCGLLAFAVSIFISELLMRLPATLDTSAWYFGNTLALVAVAVALASWGLYTVLPRSAPARTPA